MEKSRVVVCKVAILSLTKKKHFLGFLVGFFNEGFPKANINYWTGGIKLLTCLVMPGCVL